MADPRAASRSWADAIVVSILALLLLPAILSNALLWYERLSGVGLYDAATGGDPAWKHRPLLGPSLVAVDERCPTGR